MVDSLDVRVRLLEARTAQMEAQKTQRALRGIGKSAEDSNKKQKESSSGLLASMKGVTTLAAGAGVYEFFKQGVSGALNLQQSMTTVRNSLAQIGIRSGQVTNQLRAQAEAASTAGGGTTEEELAGLAQYIQQTHSLTQAQQAQTAANALARGSGMGYARAQELISSAEAGRVRGIQRYIGVVQPVKTAEDALTASHKAQVDAIDAQAKAMGKAGGAWKTAQLNAIGFTSQMRAQATQQDKLATAQQIVTAITNRYRNAQESTRQKLEDARHAFQNLTANLATALLPTINRLIRVASSVAEFLSKHKTLAEALAITIGTLATVVLAGRFVKALKSASAELKLSALASRIFGTSAQVAGDEAAAGAEVATVSWRAFATATLIGLLITAIILVITHFKQVKQIAESVFRAVLSVVTTVWHWIEGHWKLLATVFAGPLAPLILMITHLKEIWHLVKRVGHDIGHFFGGVGHFIGSILHTGGLVHAATGGTIYRQIGGPSGTDTVPAMLTPGEYVLNRSVTSQIGLGNLQGATSRIGAGVPSGQPPIQIRIEPQPIKLDSRLIAQGVLRASLDRAARGVSSLSGGALATTGGYTSLATGAPA